MKWTIICGGSAGQGPNFVSNLIARGLIESGFYVFTSREYESQIRGGHNYNIITFSDKPVFSNCLDVDILIALDDLSIKNHRKELKKESFIIKADRYNASAAGGAFKLLGIDLSILDSELKKLHNYNENFNEAKKGYENEKRFLNLPKLKKNENINLISGSKGVALGAVESGLDFYYAYPMTPATGLLFELSKTGEKNKYVTIQLESEIAVVNAAIGSAITGAKSMIGTSGGGFDLMTEALSLAGGIQAPLVMYLAQRPGPSTGVPTYTAQADLNMARHAGHGEFLRVVAAPGDPNEAAEKTSELFCLTQKYQIPGILLSDKHLADSFYSLIEKPNLIKSEKSIKWPNRVTSYEADENKIANTDPENIINSVDKRHEKYKKLCDEIEKLTPYKIYGKRDSKNIILGWGSTKGAIIDSIEGLDCKYFQIIYLEPISNKIKFELEKAKNIIIVENNKTSMLSSLITEKTGVLIKEENKILKYDGRPFYFEFLQKEIKKRLK